ncbi:MAG: SIS domain-containing protein [Candidatus Promineifilaceae bacterium]
MKNSHLYQEIHQQPDVLRNFLHRERPSIQALADAIRQRDITHVVIAARGTSDNAGRYAQYILGAHNGLQIALSTPSLFTIYERPIHFRQALVLGISQSGKSPDIVAVVAEARRQNQLTAVITNNPNSDLGQVGDYVIDLGAGDEKSVAATKTYTAELMAVALLSALLSSDADHLAQLETVPDAAAKMLALQDAMAQIAPRYRYMTRSIIIGRGYNYATAYEMALKVKELTYTIAEPYSSADFMHGPLALIEPGFPVVVLAPSGKMLPEMQHLVASLNERQAEVIAISDDETILETADIAVQLTAVVPEWLSPITTIIPGQLFAMNLAHTRHYNVDRPRAIQKVTETR